MHVKSEKSYCIIWRCVSCMLAVIRAKLQAFPAIMLSIVLEIIKKKSFNIELLFFQATTFILALLAMKTLYPINFILGSPSIWIHHKFSVPLLLLIENCGFVLSDLPPLHVFSFQLSLWCTAVHRLYSVLHRWKGHVTYSGMESIQSWSLKKLSVE